MILLCLFYIFFLGNTHVDLIEISKSENEECLEANLTMKSIKIFQLPNNFNFQDIPIEYENATWEVIHSFVVGPKVKIPQGVTLIFNGGSFNSGDVIFNNTKIVDTENRIFNSNLSISGSLSNSYVRPEWWGAVGNDLINDFSALQKASSSGFDVVISKNYLSESNLNFNSTVNILPNGGIITKGKAIVSFNHKINVDELSFYGDGKFVFNGSLTAPDIKIFDDSLLTKTKDEQSPISFGNEKNSIIRGEWFGVKNLAHCADAFQSAFNSMRYGGEVVVNAGVYYIDHNMYMIKSGIFRSEGARRYSRLVATGETTTILTTEAPTGQQFIESFELDSDIIGCEVGIQINKSHTTLKRIRSWTSNAFGKACILTNPVASVFGCSIIECRIEAKPNENSPIGLWAVRGNNFAVINSFFGNNDINIRVGDGINSVASFSIDGASRIETNASGTVKSDAVGLWLETCSRFKIQCEIAIAEGMTNQKDQRAMVIGNAQGQIDLAGINGSGQINAGVLIESNKADILFNCGWAFAIAGPVVEIANGVECYVKRGEVNYRSNVSGGYIDNVINNESVNPWIGHLRSNVILFENKKFTQIKSLRGFKANDNVLLSGKNSLTEILLTNYGPIRGLNERNELITESKILSLKAISKKQLRVAE